MRSISMVLILLAASPLARAQGARPHPPNQRNAENNQRQHGQQHRGEWLRKYKEIPQPEQEKALRSDPDFQKLPPERQQKLKQRLEQFNTLPPQQKDKIVQRMEAFDRLTPDQQQRARDMQSRLHDIPEDRRQQMRHALRNLRQMDPQQREQVMNSDRFKSMFSENERDVMRGLSDLPVGPGERDVPRPPH